MPTGEMIRLKNVRLSFAALSRPKLPKGETDPLKAKYKATFLLDPSNPEHVAQIAAVKASAKAIRAAQWQDAKVQGLKPCFKLNVPKAPGSEEDEEDVLYEGWENMFSVVTSESEKPKQVNAKGIPVEEGHPGAPYSGCYVDAWITLWTQDNSFGKRINGNLLAVQFRGAGDAFSSRQGLVDGIKFDDLSGQAPAAAGAADDDIDF